MHKSNLKVTLLHKPENDRLREKYRKLLEDLPECSHDKWTSENLQTELDKAKAVVGLIKFHPGEVVELAATKCKWELCPKSPGSASDDEFSWQWWCRKEGQVVETPEDPGYGFPTYYDGELQIQEQVGAMAKKHGHPDQDLWPHW